MLSICCTRCVNSFSSVPVASSQPSARRRSLLENLPPCPPSPPSPPLTQSAWYPVCQRPAATSFLCFDTIHRKKMHSVTQQVHLTIFNPLLEMSVSSVQFCASKFKSRRQSVKSIKVIYISGYMVEQKVEQKKSHNVE